jgi:hypothetical protein
MGRNRRLWPLKTIQKNMALFAKTTPFSPKTTPFLSHSILPLALHALRLRTPATCPCTKPPKNLQIMHEIALPVSYRSLFSTLCSLPRNCSSLNSTNDRAHPQKTPFSTLYL